MNEIGGKKRKFLLEIVILFFYVLNFLFVKWRLNVFIFLKWWFLKFGDFYIYLSV